MGAPPDPHTETGANHPPSAAEVSPLVERVSGSEQFQKSPRLRELFHYLCKQSVDERRGSVSEHQIGVEVFGRPAGYDTGADTIVRVQVSQLRKKLEHYFLTEGQHEPIVVEIPRGSYAPVFRHRERPQREAVPETAAHPGEARTALPQRHLSRTMLVWVGACVVVVLLVFAFWPTPKGGEARLPNLDRLWKPFQNGRPTQVIVSDANLIILSDLMRHTATLHEYRAANYPTGILDSRISDPATRALAERIAETHMTGIQDATVSRTLMSIGDRYHFTTTLMSARDFRMPQPDNLILLGHAKGNPWVELFEDRMNFDYDFDYDTRRGRIINKNPQKGEQPAYSAAFGNQGYCVIAFLPKPVDEGVALVIFGSDMSSLEAGGRFISDEKSIRQLFARIGTSGSDRPPYFEVLLRTRLLMNLAPGFEIVTHRLPKI